MIADPASASAALDPVRARLLAELREPASAATLAARLGLPRQRINYHLRLLEKHGLVEVASTRAWGGLTERHLVATAAGYVVSPDALGAAAPRLSTDRMSAGYIIALAARLVAEVGAMARNAARLRKRLPVFGLDAEIRFASPADRAAFAEKLTVAVNLLVSEYHDEAAPEGRWQRLMIAVHPVPKHIESEPS